jgi:hypothetical protein
MTTWSLHYDQLPNFKCVDTALSSSLNVSEVHKPTVRNPQPTCCPMGANKFRISVSWYNFLTSWEEELAVIYQLLEFFYFVVWDSSSRVQLTLRMFLEWSERNPHS